MNEYEYKIYGDEFYVSGIVRADSYADALQKLEDETKYHENKYSVRLKMCGK